MEAGLSKANDYGSDSTQKCFSSSECRTQRGNKNTRIRNKVQDDATNVQNKCNREILTLYSFTQTY